MGDGHALGEHVVLCMQHEAAIAVHGTADMDRVFGAEPRRADIKLFIEIPEIEPRRRSVDDKPHGGVRIVMTHQDHRFLETFVADMGAGDQQMSLKG